MNAPRFQVRLGIGAGDGVHGVEAQALLERALDGDVVQVDHHGAGAARVATREGHDHPALVTVAVAEAHVATVHRAGARREVGEHPAHRVDIARVDHVDEPRARERGRRVTEQRLDRRAEKRNDSGVVDDTDHVARVRDERLEPLAALAQLGFGVLGGTRAQHEHAGDDDQAAEPEECGFVRRSEGEDRRRPMELDRDLARDDRGRVPSERAPPGGRAVAAHDLGDADGVSDHDHGAPTRGVEHRRGAERGDGQPHLHRHAGAGVAAQPDEREQVRDGGDREDTREDPDRRASEVAVAGQPDRGDQAERHRRVDRDEGLPRRVTVELPQLAEGATNSVVHGEDRVAVAALAHESNIGAADGRLKGRREPYAAKGSAPRNGGAVIHEAQATSVPRLGRWVPSM